MMKRHGDATYLFAVSMRNAPARATFEIPELNGDATAEVLGEARIIPVRNGTLADDFKPYEVHLYRLRSSDGEKP
jgi:hypothetical protein